MKHEDEGGCHANEATMDVCASLWKAVVSSPLFKKLQSQKKKKKKKEKGLLRDSKGRPCSEIKKKTHLSYFRKGWTIDYWHTVIKKSTVSHQQLPYSRFIFSLSLRRQILMSQANKYLERGLGSYFHYFFFSTFQADIATSVILTEKNLWTS